MCIDFERVSCLGVPSEYFGILDHSLQFSRSVGNHSNAYFCELDDCCHRERSMAPFPRTFLSLPASRFPHKCHESDGVRQVFKEFAYILVTVLTFNREVFGEENPSNTNVSFNSANGNIGERFLCDPFQIHIRGTG